MVLDTLGLFASEICSKNTPIKVYAYVDCLNMSTIDYGNAYTANWSLTGVTKYTCVKDSL